MTKLAKKIGMDINLTHLGCEDSTKLLFSENTGIIIQSEKNLQKEFLSIDVECLKIGKINNSGLLNNINFENTLCSSSQRTKETISIINEVSPHSIGEIDYLDSLYHASSNKIKEIIQKTKTSKLKIGYKFGLEFLNSKNGRAFVSKLKNQITFGDYKFADIPNTCASAVKAVKDLNFNYLTIHISSGLEALKAAKKVSGKTKIIGVTVSYTHLRAHET